MRLADGIGLTRLPEDGKAVRCRLRLPGVPRDVELSGCVLEAAIACDAGWLLFLTDDVPYEDLLSIHLLDAAGRLLDTARIGGAYSTGSFSDLRLEPPSTARFRFIDDADWSVELLEQAKWALPWVPDAKGVGRGAGVSRRFVVRRR